MKKGFLIVSRGTVEPLIREKYLRELELLIEERNEGLAVRRAFTNPEIRRKLRELTGESVKGVKGAMFSLKEEGVTDLYILSTHVVAGEDYRQMSDDLSSCASMFSSIHVARPLVEHGSDFDLCARAVHSVYGDRVGDDCLILMARGAADQDTEEIFEKFENVLSERFGGRAYIATLNGRRNLTTVLMDMRRHGRNGRVVVAPFSFLLGDLGYHMYGGENSYEDRLSAQGYETDIVEDGLGIHDAFLRLYLKHLYEA